MGRHIDIQVNKGHHEHEKEAPTGLQQVLFQKIEVKFSQTLIKFLN